jgi:hypothetical protein
VRRVEFAAYSGFLAMVLVQPALAQDAGDYFDHWYDRVTAALSSQSHWMTPLMTMTPRLEEEFRYDQYFRAHQYGLTRPGRAERAVD